MKERIMHAAAQEMNERGVKFTIDSVAAKLGISKKTVYQHYASKDELISTIVNAALADMEAQMKAVLADKQGAFKLRLRTMLLAEPRMFGKINDWVLDDLRKYNPEEWRKVDSFRRAKIKLIAKLLEEGLSEEAIRNVNVHVAAQMLLGACTEMLQYDFLTNNNITLSDALETVTDIYLYGVLKEGKNERV